jgi:hypothetical protein
MGMVQNLTPEKIYHFIVDDFIGAWNSVASNSDQYIGRGNFMFASQAMRPFEFAARLYDKDTSGRQTFSNVLYDIKPKYFTNSWTMCSN